MQGTIKVLLNGFGFIKIEGEDKDLFFHLEDLKDVKFEDLTVGDTVFFDKGESPKGPKADNVSLVAGDLSAAA